MRVLFAVPFLFAAVEASAWEKIYECGDNEAVIDMENRGYHGTFFQLVIRNGGAARHLSERSAVSYERLIQGQLILPLVINRFNSSEFVGQEDAYQTRGIVYYVKPNGDRLFLEAFRTSQPTGGTYTTEEKAAELTFEGCRFLR